MANFYTDVPEIRFEMENSPLMQRIVDLKERDYADKDKYDEAPQDYEDALDNYHRVLDIVGKSPPTLSPPTPRRWMPKALTVRTAACAMPPRPTRTSMP